MYNILEYTLNTHTHTEKAGGGIENSFDNFLCILSDFMTKNYVKKIDSNKIYSSFRRKIAFLLNFV